jgi:hypothetical protein
MNLIIKVVVSLVILVLQNFYAQLSQIKITIYSWMSLISPYSGGFSLH